MDTDIDIREAKLLADWQDPKDGSEDGESKAVNSAPHTQMTSLILGWGLALALRWRVIRLCAMESD